MRDARVLRRPVARREIVHRHLQAVEGIATEIGRGDALKPFGCRLFAVHGLGEHERARPEHRDVGGDMFRTDPTLSGLQHPEQRLTQVDPRGHGGQAQPGRLTAARRRAPVMASVSTTPAYRVCRRS